MPLFFNIDNRLHFTVEVMFGNDLSSQRLSVIIRQVTTITKMIKQLYTGFISKMGRIHGQKRVQLVEMLDELFTVLLLLRENLKERTPQESSLKGELNMRVVVKTKINKFIVQGAMSSDDISRIESFNEGYEVLILQEVKDLLIKYKTTLDSEEASFDKYIDLYNDFDEVFYNTILMRYSVENLLIDK